MNSTKIIIFARPASERKLKAAAIEKSVLCGDVADVTAIREHAKLAVQRRNGKKQ